MKKILSLIISMIMLITSLCFVSCGKESKECEHPFFLYETIKNSTCIEEGERKVECEYCGYFYIEKINKTEHQWGEYTIVKESTFYETGEKLKTCKICNIEKREKIDKLNILLPSTPLILREDGTILKIIEFSWRYELGGRLHILEYKCEVVSMNESVDITYKAYDEENTVIDVGHDYVLETKYSTGDVFTGEIYTKLGSCKKRCIIKIFTN